MTNTCEGAEFLENFTGDGIDADGYGHGTHVCITQISDVLIANLSL